MSRKLVQTVASLTAKQLRVAVAMLAALALGVGGAAAAVGSLNAANVANESTQVQTVTAEDDPSPAATEGLEGEDDGADSGSTVTAGAVDDGNDSASKSDRNQDADACTIPAQFLPAPTTEPAPEPTESAEPTPTTEPTPTAEPDLPTWRNHGQFVRWVAQNPDVTDHAGAVQWAAQSDCGKPMVSVKGTDEEATGTEEGAEPEETSVETESLTTKRPAKADHDQRGNGHAKAKSAKAHGQGNGR